MTENQWESIKDPYKLLVSYRSSENDEISPRKCGLMIAGLIRTLRGHKLSTRLDDSLKTIESAIDKGEDQSYELFDEFGIVPLLPTEGLLAQLKMFNSGGHAELAHKVVKDIMEGPASKKRTQISIPQSIVEHVKIVNGSRVPYSWKCRCGIKTTLSPYRCRSCNFGYDSAPGEIDVTDVRILADRIIDVIGSDDHPIVRHLMGHGPHFLGCWAIDALLGY